MDTLDTKRWYESRTIWLALIALAATILRAFKIDISPEDQGQLADIILSAIAALGTAGAIYTRATATRQIGAK